MKTMRVVHRDVRDDEATRIDSHKTNLRQLISDLEQRQVYPEDVAEFQPALQEWLAVRE